MLDLEKNLQSEAGKIQKRLAIQNAKISNLVEGKRKQEYGIKDDVSSFKDLDNREENKEIKIIEQEIDIIRLEIRKLDADFKQSTAPKDFIESPFDKKLESTHDLF